MFFLRFDRRIVEKLNEDFVGILVFVFRFLYEFGNLTYEVGEVGVLVLKKLRKKPWAIQVDLLCDYNCVV